MRRRRRLVVVCVFERDQSPWGKKRPRARAVANNADHQNALSKASAFFVIFSLVGPRPDASRRTKRGRRKPRRLLRERKRKNPIRRAFLPKRRRMLSRTINLFLSDHSLTCFSPSLSLSLSHTHRRNHFVPTAPIPTGPRPGTRARRDF